jgi:hypothetical protein
MNHQLKKSFHNKSLFQKQFTYTTLQRSFPLPEVPAAGGGGGGGGGGAIVLKPQKCTGTCIFLAHFISTAPPSPSPRIISSHCSQAKVSTIIIVAAAAATNCFFAAELVPH